MSRIRVAVIFGGKSNEHDVSLISATHVIKSISREKYKVIRIGITKKGHWLKYIGDVDDIANGQWEKHPDNVPCVLSPDPLHKGFLVIDEDGSVSNLKIDCVFPVLHGKNGEDGTIQGLLQLAQIPFVGCDMISSANCMDKDTTHTILEAHGIKTAKWVTLIESELDMLNDKCKQIESELTYPMFVKPANCGSSVGISKAHNLDELKRGIKMAFTHDTKVLVEQGLVGVECECAVMGNENPYASTIGEIEAANEFYDYDAKYENAASKVIIPARFDDDTMTKIREEAIKAYKAMGCGGLARVDFFLCDNNEIVVNEINTLPGHTSISMYPKLMEYDGMPFEEQEDKLIKLAIDRAGVDYE
ncbi:MAG: D-alanine--D-alanine ligase [Ruminococcus sp.]|nr:D-alanine--D-alanine ligase [Ruminococcus sp.]